MPADTFDRLKRIIVDHLGVDQAKVTASAEIRNDLGADSLDAIELVMACEEEFHIEISDEQIERIKIVGDVVGLIDRLWAEQHP